MSSDLQPVLVKVRSHIHEKASYVPCFIHIEGHQLRLVKRGGGSADIVVLSSHRVFSTAYKHGKFYVIIESGSKVVKLKLETAAAQRHWLDVLEGAFSTEKTSSSSFPTPWLLAKDRPSAATQIEDQHITFDFSNEAIDKLTSSFHRDSLDTAVEDPGTPSSVSSIALSVISSPPAIPARPRYTFQNHGHLQRKTETHLSPVNRSSFTSPASPSKLRNYDSTGSAPCEQHLSPGPPVLDKTSSTAQHAYSRTTLL